MKLSLWILCLSIALCTASKIQLKNNGYEGIVVAISPNLPPDEGLIPKIKDLFTRASPVLYNATRNRAYFRDVTILIPYEWPKSSTYLRASFQTFEDADIRIDTPNPEYGDGPYTLQTKPCGEPGEYIHLTPGYVNNYLSSNYLELFGDSGKTIVHEWAHLRWGVFDEFGIPGSNQYPIFYTHDDKVLPTLCSNAIIEGMYWDLDDQAPCQYDESNIPNSTCNFIPDYSSKVTSSLTSMHQLPLVHTFCDNSEEHKHNSDAPTKQNQMCNGQSAWEVITNTEDFRNNQNPPSNIPNVVPNFYVVQKREVGTEFVFVLDISGSMDSDNKRTLLHDTVVRWLRYELKLENAVGIVTFDSFAYIEHSVVKVTSEGIRNQLINKVPNKAVGGTCIMCGVRKGLEVLRAYNRGEGGGVILLLTDGIDSPGYVEAVKNEVLHDKVKIITIAFTENADHEIEKLADLTGGKSFFVNSKSPKELLNQAFYESSSLQTVTSSFSFSLKLGEKKYNGASTRFSGEFLVDFSVGKNTSIDFTYNSRSHVKDITITGPSLSASLGNAIDDRTSKIIRFVFPDLQIGKYNYVISASGASDQEFIVTTTSSRRDKNVEPIKTRCWVDVTMNPYTNKRNKVVVYAEVKQGNNAVIHASVMAKIDRPIADSVYIALKDTGNGDPDATSNDGIYTAYFPNLSNVGRYTVQAQVTDGGKAQILHGFTASPSMAMASKLPIPNQSKAPPKPTGPFERVGVAGSFQIDTPIKPNEDMFPPVPIKDLEVVMADPRNASVILRWTSPGDDWDQGTVAGYDLRFSRETNTMKTNFEKSMTINMASFKPLPGGTVVTYEFDIPKFTSGYTYYFAMKSVDDAGHWSKISNTAQTYIRLVRRAVCK